MSDWTLTEDDGIAVLTFARPPRNFMSFAAITELGERLRELGERIDVSVVVLTGGLPGYFVAHADLEDLGRLGRGEPVDGDPRAWNATLAAIEALAQPVVAAINGQCWGGGCELALACAVRLAPRSAKAWNCRCATACAWRPSSSPNASPTRRRWPCRTGSASATERRRPTRRCASDRRSARPGHRKRAEPLDRNGEDLASTRDGAKP